MTRFGLTILLLYSLSTSWAQEITWQRTLVHRYAFYVVTVTPADEVLAAGSSPSSLYRSTDSGESWSQIPFVTLSNYPASIIALDSGVVLVGTEGDWIFRSSDNGASWNQIMLGSSRVFSFVRKSRGLLFAATLPGDSGRVFRSTDEGLSWTRVGQGITTPFVMDIALAPNGDLYAAAKNGVYRSSNNGDSWLGPYLDGIDVRSVAVTTYGKVFAGTFNGRILTSQDSGVSWDSSGSGLLTDWIHDILVT